MITKKIVLLQIVLLLTKLITAQVPSTWTVNPAAFQYQMTLTGKANEGCVDIANANNYIAAFVGTQCRGMVQTNTSVGANELGLITIKSNVISGEKVNFKIYNAATNATVNVLDSVTFVQGTQIGTLSNPFVLPTNHAPTDIAISSYSVAENSVLSFTIANLSAVDQDAGTTFNYSLTAGQVENTQFAISGNQLVVNTNFDYETDSIKVIQLQVDDNGGCRYVETFTLHIINVNEIPTSLSLTSPIISDHQQIASFMGEFSTIDPDFQDTHTYTLVAGAGSTDNAQFYIQNDTLYNVSQIDYTAQNIYFIRARSTDAGGLFIENTFTINVTNVNDAPTDILIDNYHVNENMPVATSIGTFTVIDPDLADTHTLTLDAGTGSDDNNKVSIVGYTLQTNVSYNFEQQDSLFIRVRATDPFGAYYVKTFTIVVNDVNDAPTNINLSKDSIAELLPLNSYVGDLTSADEDVLDTHTYSLVPGAGSTDNALFAISSNSLVSNITYTYTHQTYSIRLRTTDNGGLFFEKIISVKIFNSNEAPTDIIIDTTSVNEDNEPMFRVSNIHSIDPDSPDAFIYTLVSGAGDTDNAEFAIQNNSLVIKEKTNSEVKDVYYIRLKSTDLAGLSVEKAFEIHIADIAGNSIPLPSTNYISPNGDSKNDYWKVDNVEIYKDFELNIYDQFGQVIYNVPNNYNNEFDGMYKGKSLPTGNYYYVFKKDKKSFKGNITIVN